MRLGSGLHADQDAAAVQRLQQPRIGGSAGGRAGHPGVPTGELPVSLEVAGPGQDEVRRHRLLRPPPPALGRDLQGTLRLLSGAGERTGHQPRDREVGGTGQGQGIPSQHLGPVSDVLQQRGRTLELPGPQPPQGVLVGGVQVQITALGGRVRQEGGRTGWFRRVLEQLLPPRRCRRGRRDPPVGAGHQPCQIGRCWCCVRCGRSALQRRDVAQEPDLVPVCQVGREPGQEAIEEDLVAVQHQPESFGPEELDQLRVGAGPHQVFQSVERIVRVPIPASCQAVEGDLLGWVGALEHGCEERPQDRVVAVDLAASHDALGEGLAARQLLEHRAGIAATTQPGCELDGQLGTDRGPQQEAAHVLGLAAQHLAVEVGLDGRGRAVELGDAALWVGVGAQQQGGEPDPRGPPLGPVTQ
ncbi:MAG: hypothetical protein EA387_03260 [Nitriliruptor sp.]|nr:MAG: hypothetical protein EA387_03260 [Nitriliruptor sp.]